MDLLRLLLPVLVACMARKDSVAMHGLAWEGFQIYFSSGSAAGHGDTMCIYALC